MSENCERSVVFDPFVLEKGNFLYLVLCCVATSITSYHVGGGQTNGQFYNKVLHGLIKRIGMA